MLRVLQIVGSLGYAGLETVVMNYYRHIDKNKIQFDFVVGSLEKQRFDDEIIEMGGNIYRIPFRSRHPISYLNQLKKIIKEKEYKIIHIHQNSASLAMEAMLAKLCGVKVIIGHSHNTSCDVLWQHYLFRPFTNLFCTEKFACSIEAGRWVFGNKNCYILNNAVDVERFQFNDVVRNVIRKKMNLENKLVIGFVGRLHEQKNPLRFLRICANVINTCSNTAVVIVGDGPLLNSAIKYSKKLGIEKSVFFVGRQENIPDWMSVFDVFVMPSLYEGLGLVAIEAQVSGLKCVLSDSVPAPDINKNVTYLSLDEDDSFWKKCILDFKLIDRLDVKKIIASEGYDISKEVKKLESFYLEHV